MYIVFPVFRYGKIHESWLLIISSIVWWFFFFLNSWDIVHKECIPQRQKFYQLWYREVFEWHERSVPLQRLFDTSMLHHDVASCHIILSRNECLAKKSITVIQQSAYLVLVLVIISYSPNSKTTSEMYKMVRWRLVCSIWGLRWCIKKKKKIST